MQSCKRTSTQKKKMQTEKRRPQHLSRVSPLGETDDEDRYLLEVCIDQCVKFKGTFDVIKDLLFDTNIYFDDTGMKICSLDNSKVALVHYKVPSGDFAYFKCDRPQVLGVSITALHKYLGHISQSNKHTIRLLVDRNRSHELVLEIVSDDDTDTQRFYMKLLDLPLDDGGLDGEKFNCVINIPSDKFQRYCRSHALVGDIMDIITVGDQVELTTEDTDGPGDRTKSIIRTTSPPSRQRGEGGTADEDEDDEDDDEDDDEVPDEKRTSIFLKDKDDTIAGRFSLRFLQMFAKAQKLSPTVRIYFKLNFPLVLLYQMKDFGTLKFALAPRAEER